MTERLRWSPDENERLERASLPLLVADPKMTIVSAVRHVQDTVLSADRRRALRNIGEVPTTLRFALENKRKLALGTAEMVPVSDLKDAVTRAEEAEAKLSEQDATIGSLTRSLTEAESQLGAMRVKVAELEPEHVLRNYLVGVVAEALARDREVPGGPRAIPLSSIATAAAETVVGSVAKKHDPEPPRLPRPQLPRIMVCGLKPDQRAHFESYFAGRVIFKFWYQEPGHGNENGISEKARGVDMVYLLMGAVSHAAVAAVVRANPSFQRVADYRRDSLREMIDTWIARREKAG